MAKQSQSPYLRRLAGVRARLQELKADALLVTYLPNVHYLTGFTGSAGVLAVTPSQSVFFSDSRYDLQARQEVRDSRVVIAKGDALAAAAKLLSRQRGVQRVGFESETLSVRLHQKLRELLAGKRLRATAGLVETLRIVKDEGEIEQIRKAVDMGSLVFTEVIGHLRPGMTETDVAAEIEYRMRLHGAERPSFETIVATGPRSALPHARPGGRKLQRNEFVLLDLGVILSGYASDMTRTVFLGEAPPKAAKMYRAVLEAQLAAEETVKAGRPCSAVDRAARRVLERRGYGRYFTHSTGHGLGREIHELPRIAKQQDYRLPAGAAITVEPGVYIPGYGGVRIEDVVIVREDGPEVLTAAPKDLTLLQI